jgi:hypothetical protein
MLQGAISMIFIDNKYTHWYYNIVNAAVSRTTTTDYTENHHIIPRSLGGNNSASNLVKLTAKEHFICHRLLTKMVCEDIAKIKMYNAAFQMTIKSSNQERYKITSRTYEVLKRNKSNAMIGNTYGRRPMSEETKRKISEAKQGISVGKGKKLSDETKKKLSASIKGRVPWNVGLTYKHKNPRGKKQ